MYACTRLMPACHPVSPVLGRHADPQEEGLPFPFLHLPNSHRIPIYTEHFLSSSILQERKSYRIPILIKMHGDKARICKIWKLHVPDYSPSVDLPRSGSGRGGRGGCVVAVVASGDVFNCSQISSHSICSWPNYYYYATGASSFSSSSHPFLFFYRPPIDQSASIHGTFHLRLLLPLTTWKQLAKIEFTVWDSSWVRCHAVIQDSCLCSPKLKPILLINIYLPQQLQSISSNLTSFFQELLTFTQGEEIWSLHTHTP